MKKTTLRPGQKIDLHIDRLSVGGRGVGRYEGAVVFVPDTTPDEDVEVELTFVKKNFAEGRLLQIKKPSPFRVEPPCRLAGQCGGCNWQHVAYPEQLKQKRDLVRDALRKFSGFDVSGENAVMPTIASPNELHYRNRVQLHHAKGRLGFHKRGSHDIIDLEDCLITEPKLTAMFAEQRQELAHRPPGRIELFLSDEGHASVRRAEIGAANDESLTETAFSQVNTGQNENLIRYVLEAFTHEIGTQVEAQIYDLYAGNGNFTLPLARAFPLASIASAELSSRTVEAARKRASKEFPNRGIRVELADVAKFLRNEKFASNAFVLLDPPRTGCDPEVMQELVAKTPRTIIYVSCHPVTLARDLRFLSDRYELASVQPFDMFPQTDHVETVAVLRRRD